MRLVRLDESSVAKYIRKESSGTTNPLISKLSKVLSDTYNEYLSGTYADTNRYMEPGAYVCDDGTVVLHYLTQSISADDGYNDAYSDNRKSSYYDYDCEDIDEAISKANDVLRMVRKYCYNLHEYDGKCRSMDWVLKHEGFKSGAANRLRKIGAVDHIHR